MELRQSKPVSERCIDIERLFCKPETLLGRKVLQRTHIMKAVGKLYKHDSNISHHRKEHLAVTFRLCHFMTFEDIGYLCDAIDYIRYGIAEFCADIFQLKIRIFYDIV